jgi:hypothetical protein
LTEQTTNAVTATRDTLLTQMETLIHYLNESGDPMALGFFNQIYDMTANVSEEDELLELFLALSTTAFQGFVLDPYAAALTDDILAFAEQVSHTFSASGGSVH